MIRTLLFGSIAICPASAVDFLPVSDGTVYSSSDAVTQTYLLASYSAQGALEFAAFDPSPYARFYLALNPYGLPLWDSTLDVFGYSKADGQITGADYGAGAFLGTLSLPLGLGFGQDALFDVTDFVGGASGQYFGFSLRADSGTDVFSSLEYNYGSLPRLVAQIPDPAGGSFFLFTATFAFMLWRRGKP